MATNSGRRHAISIATPRQRQIAVKLNADERAQNEILRRAAEVLGDKSTAMRWLGTPVRALGYATPISLLHDSKGREDVLTALGRLEQGVL
jgi:putative toxin-antitoxin system antitoxin component (TIGR02293 family)